MQKRENVCCVCVGGGGGDEGAKNKENVSVWARPAISHACAFEFFSRSPRGAALCIEQAHRGGRAYRRWREAAGAPRVPCGWVGGWVGGWRWGARVRMGVLVRTAAASRRRRPPAAGIQALMTCFMIYPIACNIIHDMSK